MKDESMNEWRAFDYMNADGVEDTSVQRGDVYDPFTRLSFDAYDDEHATMWCEYLNDLGKQNADLVLVVEKLLAGARGHYTSCSVWRGKKRTPCTCGADEARELLLKIRGEA